ncbi:MAG: sigma factor-like helix-turn-helix DNA-binding protein [Patescibacteria group bacterium]
MSSQTAKYFITIIKTAKELDKKEKDILIKRLRDTTLKTIGKKYKVSAERIRQIEQKSLQKFIKKMCQLMLFD